MATIKKYVVQVVNLNGNVVERSFVTSGQSKAAVVEDTFVELAKEMDEVKDGIVTAAQAADLIKNAKKYRIKCDLVRYLSCASKSSGAKPSKNAKRKARRRAAAKASSTKLTREQELAQQYDLTVHTSKVEDKAEEKAA